MGVARSAAKMPTQSTQTAWSWLQDLAEVARLSRKGGDFSLSSAEIDRWLQEEAPTVDENDSRHSPTSLGEAVSFQLDRTATSADEASVDGVNPPRSLLGTDRQGQVLPGLGGEGELDRGGGSGTVTNEEEQTEIPALAQDATLSQECGEKHRVVKEGLKLPPIANERTQQSASQAGHSKGDESLKRNQQEVVGTSEELLQLPPIATQLEGLEFPSDSESNSEEDEPGDSSTECEEQGTPPFPNVQSLPWPAILQYLRESESMASEYFSLASDRLGTTGELGLLPSGNTLCDFCGKVTPKRSLLISAGGTEFEVSHWGANCFTTVYSSTLPDFAGVSLLLCRVPGVLSTDSDLPEAAGGKEGERETWHDQRPPRQEGSEEDSTTEGTGNVSGLRTTFSCSKS